MSFSVVCTLVGWVQRKYARNRILIGLSLCGVCCTAIIDQGHGFVTLCIGYIKPVAPVSGNLQNQIINLNRVLHEISVEKSYWQIIFLNLSH